MIYYYIDNSKDNFFSTIGISNKNKQIICELKIKVNASFVTTTGQERFRSMPKQYYQKSDAIILCFDMNDKLSFEFINNLAIDLVNYNTNIPFAFFAKKGCDEDQDIIINDLGKLPGKIFYYNNENKTGIDAGIGYLANKFIK